MAGEALFSALFVGLTEEEKLLLRAVSLACAEQEQADFDETMQHLRHHERVRLNQVRLGKVTGRLQAEELIECGTVERLHPDGTIVTLASYALTRKGRAVAAAVWGTPGPCPVPLGPRSRPSALSERSASSAPSERSVSGSRVLTAS